VDPLTEKLVYQAPCLDTFERTAQDLAARDVVRLRPQFIDITTDRLCVASSEARDDQMGIPNHQVHERQMRRAWIDV
jgi:hypothetical protein